MPLAPQVCEKLSLQHDALGFFDRHGNMSEWCLDHFSDYPLSEDGRARDFHRAFGVLRGGCWFVTYRHGRSATRDRLLPARLLGTVGLRVLRELPKL